MTYGYIVTWEHVGRMVSEYTPDLLSANAFAANLIKHNRQFVSMKPYNV